MEDLIVALKKQNFKFRKLCFAFGDPEFGYIWQLAVRRLFTIADSMSTTKPKPLIRDIIARNNTDRKLNMDNYLPLRKLKLI